jgi:hypothetical protein
MPSAALRKSVGSDLPILFINIGWAVRYDGTETIRGNHKYIREHPGAAVGESRAFVANHKRIFKCGIGYGKVPSPLHIVFVARDPGDWMIKAVGIYVAANGKIDKDNWVFAKTKLAERIPVERRPYVLGWPTGQGMRRWAKCNGKPDHKNLLKIFLSLANQLRRGGLPRVKLGPAEDEDGHEGKLRKLLVRQRKREHRLRRRKIADAMRQNNGHLICEVPRCGFDFHARYGELGAGFAEVHHKKPLSYAPPMGRLIPISELAVVCANCHRMIHRNGQCRPLEGLIPSEASKFAH